LIIINSNSYLNQSLQIEFGQLPLAFIPINGKRLYELQIQFLNKKYKNHKIFITIPENFEPGEADTKKLREKEISIVKADSLLKALEYLKKNFSPKEGLIIHQGDRLVIDCPKKLNQVAIAEIDNDYNYNFEYIERSDDKNKIYAGIFAFKNYNLLIQSLVKENESFHKALLRYAILEGIHHDISKKWFDLGNIKNYFYTKSVFTTERSFNVLKIKNYIVSKSGNDKRKIINEASWYEKVPSFLKIYVPQYYYKNNKSSGYSIEYLNNQSLSDLFVFGRHSIGFWKLILDKLNNYLLSASSFKAENTPTTIENLSLEKTKLRLFQIKKQLKIDLDTEYFINNNKIDSINNMFADCSERILKQKPLYGFLHGDLCLSNILFDSRSSNIKLIDPRAEDSNKKFTNYGDINYDIAKLGHSFIGYYDFILAGQYNLERKKNKIEFEIFNNFERDEINNYILQYKFFNGKSFIDFLPIIITLFLSMIPLHNDSKKKQYALLANSMRLYKCL